MKGSPMKRNFGVGASPAKQKIWGPTPSPIDESKEDSEKRKKMMKEEFKRPPKRIKKNLSDKDYQDFLKKIKSTDPEVDLLEWGTKGEETRYKKTGSPAKQKEHYDEIKKKKKADQKYIDDLAAKRNKKAQDEYNRIMDELNAKHQYSTDSLNVANQSYRTQYQKDQDNLSVTEFNKKYPNK